MTLRDRVTHLATTSAICVRRPWLHLLRTQRTHRHCSRPPNAAPDTD